MPTLPARPDLQQLRRQAKELLRAAHAGDAEALHRMRAVSESFTLSSARLVIAREYGFSSWLRLKEEVQLRTTDLAEQVRTFCEASMRDWTGRAVRLLAARPEIAETGFAPAVVLGDVDRVEAVLARDPGVATRPDPASGWTPLHAVCASRWHRRADVVDLLHRHGGHPSATVLDLFLAACLRADRAAAQRYLRGEGLRLAQLTDADHATLNRAAQIGDTAAVGLMLDLGFPIDSHAGDNGGTLHIAAHHGSAEVVQLLLARGADIEARDITWDSTALVWAMIGSSERPVHNPKPDWTTTVRTLLHAGAAIDGVRLSPDDDHPPSAEVAQLLLERGVPEDDT